MNHDEFFKPVRTQHENDAALIAEEFDKYTVAQEHQRLKDTVVETTTRWLRWRSKAATGCLEDAVMVLLAFERLHNLRD